MELKIKLDETLKKFYAIVDGKESVLQFREIDADTLEYIRTYVPPELRHHGVAARIVEYALKYAQVNRKKVIPSCSYVHDFIDKHPEFNEVSTEMS